MSRPHKASDDRYSTDPAYRELRKARARERYWANKFENQAKMQAWKDAHPEALRGYRRAYAARKKAELGVSYNAKWVPGRTVVVRLAVVGHTVVEVEGVVAGRAMRGSGYDYLVPVKLPSGRVVRFVSRDLQRQ